MWRYNAEVHQGKEEGCVEGSGCWRVCSWQGRECSRSTKQPEGQLPDHHLREFPFRGETWDSRDRFPWLVCACLSYWRQQAVRGRLSGCCEKTRSPRRSEALTEDPVSMGDDDKGSSELWRPNTHPGTGVSPEAVGTCWYPCSGSSAGSAKQWGLIQ